MPISKQVTLWLLLTELILAAGCGGGSTGVTPMQSARPAPAAADTPESTAIGAVMAAHCDAGGTVGERMAEKGIADEWKAVAVTEDNRSDTEGNLGFPIGEKAA